MRCLKQVWNLEGMQAGSPPPLLRSLKPFAANQRMPEAEITCIAVHAAGWPRITVAVGLATSQIYVLRGGSGTAQHLSHKRSLPCPGAIHPNADSAMLWGLAPPSSRRNGPNQHRGTPSLSNLHRRRCIRCETHAVQ